MKGSAFSFMLNSLGGIRVDREDKNFGFVSESIEIIDKKGIVGIFPEGRLPIDGNPFPFTTSTAFIATHCDAPIVPVFTDGNYGVFKRTSVYIGAPFYLSDFKEDGLDDEAQLKHLTKILEEKVRSLKSEYEKEKKNGK